MSKLVLALIVILAWSACSPGDDDVFTAQAGPPRSDDLVALTLPTLTTTTSTSPPTTARRAAPRPSRASVRPVRPPAPAPAAGDLLDALATCESGRNPRAVSRNGKYFGAFQFLLSTWRQLGGTGNPVDQSYEEQKAMAAKIPVSAWGGQFPHCARRLGVA